jgi:fructose-1,6-bisphosphatase/inositol monophosphatase family enzyme
MPTAPDIDTMTALLAEAADTLVLPRFRNLSPEDIEDKSTSPDREDLVTTVDRAVESWLTDAIGRLEPGALVVGEEAVHVRPELMARLASDEPVWIIDPIDGTRNFARGRDGFGIMVARVVGGSTRAAWIMLPARNEMFVAEEGSGTWQNGERISTLATDLPGPLRGSLFTRYMPADIRAHVTTSTREGLELLVDSTCAAVEYTETLKGEQDFLVYYRLLPWDHAAPALILTQAGGCVEHLDGRPYTVRSAHQLTVVAHSAPVMLSVRSRLRADS